MLFHYSLSNKANIGEPLEWKNTLLASNWGTYVGSFFQYAKNEMGILFLCGTVARNNGKPIAGEAVGNLPIGFRPIKETFIHSSFLFTTGTFELLFTLTRQGIIQVYGSMPQAILNTYTPGFGLPINFTGPTI